jgi:hypothetical protein
MRRVFVVSSCVLALAGGARADAPALTELSDEFDSAATLANWQAMQGDVIDGAPTRYGVDSGELVVHTAHSKWFAGERAFYLWKEVKGDFVATVRLRVSGEHAAVPTADWSLAGLLVRAPPTKAENWLNFTVGRVRGQSVFERKTTRASSSILVLNAAPTGWLELRQVRIGSRFYLLRRAAGRSWVLHWRYVRRDLPATLQVGFDSQSGSGDDHGDLLVHVDYVHYAPTNLPERLRQRVVRGHAKLKTLWPYLTR